MRRNLSASSAICFRITSADPEGILREISLSGIALQDISRDGELSIIACVKKNDYNTLERFVIKRGASVVIIGQTGVYPVLIQILKRPVILIFLTLLTALALIIPTRIFFVEVDGNLQIPERLIMEQAAQCGIRFGASRKAVRSEKTKNQLLSAIPQLQWAGVNTRGCVAVISVSEKTESKQPQDAGRSVSSIVAARDGVIFSCTATKGTMVCKAGQAVTAGEVLISGYTDCGLSIQATKADGEIIAQTQRSIHAISPVADAVRREMYGQKTKYSLLIGKKLINFYKDSGILDTTCVKMYEQIYWKLPGGFQLPVALVRETYSYYDIAEPAEECSDPAWIEEYAKDHLKRQMCSGSIIRQEMHTQLRDGVVILEGKFACVESIGQRRSEEILGKDGKDN